MKIRRCANCGEKAVVPVVKDYTTTQEVEGKLYTVTVPGLEMFECSKCKELYLNAEADRKIDIEIMKKAGLLLPQEFREIMMMSGLSRQDMAAQLGITVEDLTMIEAGDRIQSRKTDDMVRILKSLAGWRPRQLPQSMIPKPQVKKFGKRSTVLDAVFVFQEIGISMRFGAINTRHTLVKYQ